MNRRTFIESLLSFFAALSLGRAPGEGITLAEIAPKTIHLSELDRLLAEEAQRMSALIIKSLTQPSPYLALLNASTFPPNMGKTIIRDDLGGWYVPKGSKNALPGNGA